MTDRATQFAELYAQDRLNHQLAYYHARRVEAEKARSQAIHAKWLLCTLAAAAASVGAAVPAVRPWLAIAAAFLAAAAAALTAYQSLYEFPKLAKLYKDAEFSLQALNTAETGFRPGLSAQETRALVERIEKVFVQETVSGVSSASTFPVPMPRPEDAGYGVTSIAA